MTTHRLAKQSDYSLKLGSLQETDVKVTLVSGHEALSKPFLFNVDLISPLNNIDFGSVLYQPALLTLFQNDDERYIHGLVRSFSKIGATKTFTSYSAQIVPSLWVLENSINNRIFQNLTTEKIVQQVLTAGGISSDSISFSLKGQYNPREFCVQYNESDFDFVCRLLEEEGMFYFFNHTTNMHQMVISDSPISHSPITGNTDLIFRENRGSRAADEEYVGSFDMTHQIKTGSVSVHDFNFRRPDLDLFSTQSGQNHNNAYIYPGEFKSTADGLKIANNLLQSYTAEAKLGAGSSNCQRFSPGSKFNLKEHSVSSLNGEYLITSVSHSGSQPQEAGAESGGGSTPYSNHFTCIPSQVPFKPKQKTLRPMVPGIQTATVVGPSGEEIYTDSFGRVKVQFHWDREGTRNEQSSCWIRVGQGWAGTGWGMMFIPRIGQEVIVNFIDGNPDRPLITGGVYNGNHPPPYNLPNEKTKSTIKSETSPGGGSHNELLMEDKSGQTRVVLSNAYGHKITEDEQTKSLTIETKDQNFMRLDDQNKNITIKTTQAHTLQLDDQNKKIVATTTDGHSMQMDDKNRRMTMQSKDGHLLLLDDQNKKIEVQTEKGHNIILDDQNKRIGVTSTDGHSLVIDDSGQKITIEDNSGIHKFEIDMSGNKLVISTDSGDIDLSAPSGSISLDAMEINLEATTNVNVSANANVDISANANVDVSAMANVNITGTANAMIKGGNVTSMADATHVTNGMSIISNSSGPNIVTGAPIMLN